MQGEAKEESQESQSVEPVPPNNLLVDYLDIDFIARRTAVVGGLIYLSFRGHISPDFFSCWYFRLLDVATATFVTDGI